MKRNEILFVFVVIFLAVILTFCCTKKDSGKKINSEVITFKVEDNPKYLGSYRIQRCDPNYSNICWDEWGEWSSSLELFFDSNKRICTGNKPGVFKSRGDYYWKIDGHCVTLTKKK